MSKFVHSHPEKIDTTASSVGEGFVFVKVSSPVLREIRMRQNTPGAFEWVRASPFHIGATVTTSPKAIKRKRVLIINLYSCNPAIFRLFKRQQLIHPTLYDVFPIFHNKESNNNNNNNNNNNHNDNNNNDNNNKESNNNNNNNNFFNNNNFI